MNIDPRMIAASLLRDTTEAQLNAIGLEALRTLGERARFDIHGEFGQALFRQLAQLKGRHDVSPDQCASQLAHLDQSWAQPILGHLWWLIRLDIAVPSMNREQPNFLTMLLTPHGRRVVADLESYPLSTGYTQRLSERCPELPDEVIERFEDAAACLARGLLRPAVVALGLGYETAVEIVGEMLEESGQIKQGFMSEKPWKRIDLLLGALPKLITAKEELSRTKRALDFAHQIRDRRNDGSHRKARFPLDDSDEVHELIVSASRHLPALWALRSTALASVEGRQRQADPE